MDSSSEFSDDAPVDEWEFDEEVASHGEPGDFTDESVQSTASTNKWAPLRLGEARISVSSLGAIRIPPAPFQMVDYGIPYIGTPMRTVRIEVAPKEFYNFFVHELVWQAFNGDIPDGWEVRHKPHALQEITPLSQEASNALDDIDIYQVTVTRPWEV